MVLNITGGANGPWNYDPNAACVGSSLGLTASGLTAGRTGKGVNIKSILPITAPTGTTSMSYYYSYHDSLDDGDNFHILVNGVLVKSYEGTGLEAICATECISVSRGGDSGVQMCKWK